MQKDQPSGQPDRQPIVNYTLVALIGMLGGFIIGYVCGDGAVNNAPATTAPAMQHQR